MSNIHPDLVEKYQLILEKDPRSQVFAPLSEAYRKMGLIEEAFRISSRGVQFHPNFAGGHIALAHVLMEKGQFQNARESLEAAISLSPENILAFQKLGECCLRLKDGKAALKAFKMVLLFSPNNKRAAQAVQKLETLTADEFDDDIFKMDRLHSLHGKDQRSIDPDLEVLIPTEAKNLAQEKARHLQRQISLVDAYMVRGQYAEAKDLTENLAADFPNHPQVLKRLEKLNKNKEVESTGKVTKTHLVREAKLEMLQNLLTRVREENDRSGPLS